MVLWRGRFNRCVSVKVGPVEEGVVWVPWCCLGPRGGREVPCVEEGEESHALFVDALMPSFGTLFFGRYSRVRIS